MKSVIWTSTKKKKATIRNKFKPARLISCRLFFLNSQNINIMETISETYDRRMNKMIVEEFGISDELFLNVIPRFIQAIKLEIGKVKKIDNKRTTSFNFDFFGDGKYTILVTVNAMYFNTIEEYEEYKNNVGEVNWMSYSTKMLTLTLAYIGKKPAKNDVFDTIGHELHHVFQNIMMNKEFNNQTIYNIAIRNLECKDEYLRYLSWIVYASTKSEQEAMINGCYSEYFNNNRFINGNDVDNFIKKESECGLWLQNFYKAYNFIKMHNDKQMQKTIEQYFKKFDKKFTYKYFLFIAVNGIKNFERRIARLTLKIKNKFVNEHLVLKNNITNIIDWYRLHIY